MCKFVFWWPPSFLYLNDRHLWSKDVVEIRLSKAVRAHMHTETCIGVYSTKEREGVRYGLSCLMVTSKIELLF